MDTNKFKSLAVRKPDYDVLQGLCNQKFRSPASMISKLVNEYVQFQAIKNKMTIPAYKEHILKVDAAPITTKKKKLTRGKNGRRNKKS